MKKIIISLIIVGLFLPSYFYLKAEVSAPENIDEVKSMGEKTLDVVLKNLPGLIKKIWQEDVWPIWLKMWNWFKINIWPKLEKIIKPEIEKRKPGVEEEFQKEKKEMGESLKTDVPRALKSLWEKFKEIIK